MVQATCKPQHTSQWKTTGIEECVHPSYDHQNSIHQHFNLSAYCPTAYLYLSERLNNSVLNKSKITLESSTNLLIILMQVNNANILNQRGCCIMPLHYKDKI